MRAAGRLVLESRCVRRGSICLKVVPEDLALVTRSRPVSKAAWPEQALALVAGLVGEAVAAGAAWVLGGGGRLITAGPHDLETALIAASGGEQRHRHTNCGSGLSHTQCNDDRAGSDQIASASAARKRWFSPRVP